MLRYYAWLAARSLKRNPALTALMVLAIGLGIGASITTLTVLHILSGDPIPEKSARLFYPQIDPRTINDYHPGEAPAEQVTYPDGMNLLQAKRADRQALMTGGGAVVLPDDAAIDPFSVDARYTTADFFAMFDAPFQYGSGWKAADDDAHARDVVITRSLNKKVFGGGNSVGKTLRLQSTDFRVVGVLDDWRPTPHFYDLNSARYSDYEEVFLPLSTAMELEFGRNGSMDCWDNTPDGDQLHSPNCSWLQFWVELDTPEKAKAYQAFLNNYSDEQRSQGRFPRPNNVRLPTVMQWLDDQKVVPTDVRLQVWLSFGFLAVCLVNTIGLMLAKFLRRNGEIAVRRAIGAPRREIFAQFLVEAGAVAGAVLGLLLALFGLWGVRQQAADYAELAHIDPTMLLMTLLLALATALLSGLLPAWRACQVTPALQLKSD
ncbi:ABC transporter permease [Solimonas terrae]|uniref:ABC transporter permease n=1 Tax=Solimonas terrae TaxID=1396819 RepID=A0A6M2BNE1_9GAMM|nr:ABC transporter permease [Solimonas terrae]NGY04162.1 ABC transporter permease [Solimonas terrae]